MRLIGFAQLFCFFLLLLVITKPLGAYMARVFEGRSTLFSPLLLPVEKLIYRLAGIKEREQRWKQYAAACLAFGLWNFLIFYVLQRWQAFLPLNTQHFGTAQSFPPSTLLTPDLAFNTSVSFMTNTSWQSYAGETTLTYLSQMAGIAVQSFTSAAAGIGVALALIRGLARQQTNTVGNFWVDLTRATLYVLLPLSLAGALLLASRGVIQNFHTYQSLKTLEGGAQVIPGGPVASQESIKLLSSDGGGFFNANSAHPFENPTPFTNLVEMLLILAVPAGLTYTFGRMVRDRRQGWTLFFVMFGLLAAGGLITYSYEQRGNPLLGRQGVEQSASAGNPGGNLEGKEVRFGIPGSALFSVVSTATSSGAVNSMHDSFTPLSGLVQMFNFKCGEVIFGGPGSGMYGMLLITMVAVFIGGLMVGRTPEYLGTKIMAREMKMVMLAMIACSACILLMVACSLIVDFPPAAYMNPPGALTANFANHGPHGFSEILYAYGSATGNNGSSFAGLNTNTPWYNLTLGLAMLIGRFFVIIPVLAVAGSLAGKPRTPVTSGTLPTHGLQFSLLLLGTIIIVAALTFLPAFAVGPIVEHFLMNSGRTFSAILVF
jgi:K+-transporting ATPase ATPase A chain